jgi:hypothetical protein
MTIIRMDTGRLLGSGYLRLRACSDNRSSAAARASGSSIGLVPRRALVPPGVPQPAGELSWAEVTGNRALAGRRLSIPSLLMVSSELGAVLTQRHSSDARAIDYLEQLHHLRAAAP